MLEKNLEYVDVVADFGSNGEGVIRRDNTVVFVPFSIKGEKIRYKILKVQKSFAFGKLLEVLEPSLERVNPLCEAFTKCGGCQLQHLSYKEQLDLKSENVKNCFSKIAGLNVEIEEAEPSCKEYGYRNKLQLPVAFQNGKTVIGFYAPNSHRVVEVKDCFINPQWTKKVIEIFNRYVKEFNLKGYDEERFCGDLREITVKEINGKFIFTVVSLSKNVKGLDYLVDLLDKEFCDNYSLYININDSRSNVIYGDEFRLVKGKGEYESEMLGIKYGIGVRSFMQVNSDVCQKLYKKVSEEIGNTQNSTVIDAYSGAGLMTAILAKQAKKAIGIEIIKEAVDCANQLAITNGLSDKMTNYCGKCEEVLPKIIEKEKAIGNSVSVVIDPPRKGCDYSVLNAIINSNADRVVYVSCMPSTLARDVGLLIGSLYIENGEIKKSDGFLPRYKIEKIKPFDMFPQTKHIETLCVLTRIKND